MAFSFAIFSVCHSEIIRICVVQSKKSTDIINMKMCCVMQSQARSIITHKVLPYKSTLIFTLIMTIYLFQYVEFNQPSNCTVAREMSFVRLKRFFSILNDFASLTSSPSVLFTRCQFAICITSRFTLTTGEHTNSHHNNHVFTTTSLSLSRCFSDSFQL